MARWAAMLRMQLTSVTARQKVPRIAGLRAKLDAQTREYVEELVAVWQDYGRVPELSGQTYVRTHAMQRAWRIRSTSTAGKISYTYDNYVTDRRGKYYARIVHGGPGQPGQQAAIHAGRWPTIDDAYDEVGTREEFRERTQSTIERAMGV
jgi:hypothetical protein